jgi:predicted phosphodiesterase
VRYAVVSDIHGNWQAWTAVRSDFLAAGVDAVVCLGDVVGYGPEPARVLRDLRSYCFNFVLGNHDAAMVGRIDIARFRAGARRSAEWTRGQLDDHAFALFSATPLMMEGEDALFVHAETPAPEDYGYVEESDDALACFRAADARFIFLGHTHVPGTFVLGPDGSVEADLRTDLAAGEGCRYLVNVGSVGDPRDGTDRASYAIYDGSNGRVELRQVPFDTEACLAAIRRYPELEIPLFCHMRGSDGVLRAKDEAMTATKVAYVKVQKVLDRPRIRVRRSALAGLAAQPEARAPVAPAARPRAQPPRRHGVAWRVSAGLGLLGALALVAGGVVRARRLRGTPRDTPAPAPAAASRPVAPADPREDERRHAAMRGVIDALSVMTLHADKAEQYGKKKFTLDQVDGTPHIGSWSDPNDYLLWRIRPPRGGEYEVEFAYALDPKNDGGMVMFVSGRERLQLKMSATGSWQTFTNVVMGRIRLPAGLAVIEMRPDGKPRGGIMNLRSVTLRPVQATDGAGDSARGP